MNIRTIPLEAPDTPLADRQSMDVFIDVWNELTAESEALEQRMSDALEAHRSDCRTRYGYDFGEKGRG
jgi:hypothetical protein